ncbi:MAG: hypothetical protein HUK15_09090 [Bacteroidales bacterium]|nr:hypothetical protein [Bacteroidales bacterium]
MRKNIVLILVAILSVVMMSSCKKVATEIVGKWNVITYDTRPEGTVQITFDNNCNAIRVFDSDKGLYVDSCKYEVIQKPTQKRIIISGSHLIPDGRDDLNGTYRVETMKNNIFVAVRIEKNGEKGGAFYRLEMNKVQ